VLTEDEYVRLLAHEQDRIWFLALALLVGPSTAKAQISVDIAKITCMQFVQYKSPSFGPTFVA
jgi:hypothetical protein